MLSSVPADKILNLDQHVTRHTEVKCIEFIYLDFFESWLTSARQAESVDLSQRGHADSSGSCWSWTLSLLVLAHCKVGMRMLQGGHAQYCKVGVCKLLQGGRVDIARWAWRYCRVGVRMLQGGHVQITARWAHAYCKVGVRILQGGHIRILR